MQRDMQICGTGGNPPPLPAQNAKQEDLNKMARYLNQMDSRLSQPKLQSPTRQSLNASQASIRRKNSIEPPSPNSPFSPRDRRMMTNAKRSREMGGSPTKGDAAPPTNNRFERRGGSVIMKNNSMAELYNECSKNIVKPSHVNMRNSANEANWQTATSSNSKTFDRTNRRSDSNERDNSSKRLLNREDLLSGSPLSPQQIVQILNNK